MKANMKKLVAMGLVLVMSLGVLSACGDKAEEGSSDPSAPAASGGSVTKTSKKTIDDLGGLDFTIADWFTSEEVDESTQYLKDTNQYRKDIQSKYNFKLTRKSICSWGDMREKFVTAVTADSPEAQVYCLYETFVSQPMVNGLLYNLSTVPTLDLTEEKWNARITKKMTINGNVYGMTAEQEPRGLLFYNRRLLEEAGIDPEEPLNLQASGEWTWDKLEEYCKKLTLDTDSDGTTDQYAVGSFGKVWLPMCAASNGANFVDKDESGKFVNCMGSENFLEAMQWAVGLMDKGYIMPNPEGADWQWYKAAFRDCEVAMQVAEVYETGDFKNMDDEYSAVLFPAGPKGHMATIPMDNVFVIPACYSADEAEKIGAAFDLYTETTPGYDEEDIFKESYYPSFKETRSVDETLMLTRDSQYQCISYLPQINDLDYGDFAYAIYARATKPKEQIEKISPQWDSKIKDMNQKLEAFAAKQ